MPLACIERYAGSVRTAWVVALRQAAFLRCAAVTLAGISFFFWGLRTFLDFVEMRTGCRLDDPILALLPERDVSAFIFLIIYAGAFIVICFLLPRPWAFLFALHVFLAMQFIRAVSMYLTPLEPPVGVIPLHDPLIFQFVYGNEAKVKDLFFSGHTATLMVFLLICRRQRILRRTFAVLTVLVGCLLLLQHCHYTIDVIGAVAMAYYASAAVDYAWLKLGMPVDKAYGIYSA
ncbi:MAG: hypothetical protein KBF37_11805 [Saprospiraceae bacterium]|jgi:hypothetical protein|nr:hypothetical protein [Saprospiraceae bacterium]MBV6474200.1 hypothetical protein [Saprospiraceae bacterium]